MPDVFQPGELRRIARMISTIENRSDGFEALLNQAYRVPRWADVVGITGPPGAGKSTLVDALTAQWAGAGERIAILAVDPSSPYSGGAVLGDRIRRTRSAGMDNVYFRSLSSRGHVGGLTDTLTDLVAVLSLSAFRRVIIETVGAGQSDVEIHATADCTVVLTVPGLGDGVQASKAGLMEIGDLFVVNKCDMPGADDAARMVENALSVAYMGHPGINVHDASGAAQLASRGDRTSTPTPGIAALQRRHGAMGVDDSFWVPPVIRLSATANQGVAELAQGIDSFIEWTERSGRRQAQTRERAYAQLLRGLSSLLLAPYLRQAGSQEFPAKVATWIGRIAAGQSSPLEAAYALVTSQTAPTTGSDT